MTQKNTGYKVLIALVCGCALAAGVLLYFAQTVGYDLSIHHFAVGSPWAVAAPCVIAAALVLGVIAGILRVKDKENADFAPVSIPGIFAAALTAFMLLASFILSIRALATGMTVLAVIRQVLMALSAAYFFLAAARERKSTPAFALLSLCPLLFGLLSILTAYFDTAYALNAPIKTYTLMTWVAVTLFFSAEVRVVLNRLRPFWYTFFGACCVTLTAGVGLSRLAIALHDTVGHNFSLMDGGLYVCIALYTATRLFSFAPSAKSAETVPAEEAKDEK